MIKQFQNFYHKKDKGSKGAITVIVALSVLTVILTIGLSASYIVSGELSLSGDTSESARAYYAAETGLERAMYERFKGGVGNGEQPTAQTCGSGLWEVSGQIKYCLAIMQSDPSDYTTISSIKSVGEYGSVRRSVEISF